MLVVASSFIIKNFILFAGQLIFCHTVIAIMIMQYKTFDKTLHE